MNKTKINLGDLLVTGFDASTGQFNVISKFMQAYGLTKKADNPTVEIVGIKNFTLKESTVKASDLSSQAYDAMTETIDSTTYPDKAILTFKNERGYDVYCRSIVIDGNPIRRYKDTLIHDGLRKDDDIRKNGEKLFELGNEYIIDGNAQVPRLADYWFKYLGKKKHIYQLTIPGTALWYSVGDWYHLAAGAAGQNEYIDSNVECYDVQCERQAGTIGSTSIMFREVEENYTKTTLYATRAISGGSPKRRSQQSNTLIVASSTFTGTYDYKCDGTADDVEIQAAIQYSIGNGGGEVLLTSGVFLISNTITLQAGVHLRGAGTAVTTIKYASGTFNKYIDISAASNASLSMFTIDGSSGTLNNANNTQYVIYGNYTTCPIDNVNITNIKNIKSVAGIMALYGIYQCNNILNCNIDTMECENSSGQVAVCAAYSGGSEDNKSRAYTGCTANNIVSITTGFANAMAYSYIEMMNNCVAGTISATGGTSYSTGFSVCNKITNCLSDNSTAGAIGYVGCRSVQQCRSVNNSTHYFTSTADAGTSNPCADTADGGYNS